MIDNSYSNNNFLKNITEFYLNLVNQPKLIDYFNIYFSDNIQEDIKQFNCGKSTSILVDGITILPNNKREVITILINKNAPKEILPQYIIHELCHMYDFMLFANKYCNNKTHEIKKHEYFITLKNWSEFHVQLYIMPYYYSYLTFLSDNTIDYIDKFKNDIDWFYLKFNEKLLNKDDVYITDIMYYLGEIAMCNCVSDNEAYSIDAKIIEKYPFIDSLNMALKNMLNFESFCNNLDMLHQILMI